MLEKQVYEKPKKFVMKVFKASLKQDDKIIARDVPVKLINGRVKITMSLLPIVDPNLPDGTYCLVFTNGFEQKIVVDESNTEISPGGTTQQAVEGYVW